MMLIKLLQLVYLYKMCLRLLPLPHQFTVCQPNTCCTMNNKLYIKHAGRFKIHCTDLYVIVNGTLTLMKF